MKKLIKTISICLCAVLLGGLAFTMAGCSTSKKKDGIITIGYYSGGYGTAWLDDAIERYTAETGTEVIYDASPSVLATMESDLSNDNAYDIYISHGIPFERYAASGWLAELDDLYESEISAGVTFEDRVIDSALESSKFDGHYYKVPYTQGVGGIVYNKTMFEDNKWKIPATYAELVTLCDTIREAKVVVGDEYVSPFVWAGNGEEYMWDYLVYEWWVQLAGAEKVKNTVKYDSADVFDPDGNYKEFKEAYKLWYDLIVGNKKNSVDGSIGLNKTTSQTAFKNGRAAMIPNAHWLYNEMSSLNAGFDMAFMDTPLAPGATSDTNYNYLVGFGDSMVISKNTPNLSDAKDFLRFLSTPESCAAFTELTNGTFLAFDYSTVTLNRDNMSARALVFVDSVKNKLDTAASFSIYSSSKIAYMNTEIIPFVGNQYFYTSAFNNSSGLISGNVTPDSVFSYLYSYAKQNWKRWQTVAGAF